MFGIEIEGASWCLGISGNITFEVGRVKYRLRHVMVGGKRLEQWDGEEWSHARGVTDDEIIALLPEGNGWDMPRFIAAWAGFAEGFDKGKEAEWSKRVKLARNTVYYTVEGNEYKGTDRLPGFASTSSGMKQLILAHWRESANNVIFTIDMEAKTIKARLKEDEDLFTETFHIHEIESF